MSDNPIKEFKNKHKNKAAVILCSGPSLRDVPFDLLKESKITTFGLNGIWPNQWDFVPDYLVCVNPLAAKRFAKDIRGFPRQIFLSQAAELEIYGEPQQQASMHVLDTSLRKMVFTEDITAVTEVSLSLKSDCPDWTFAPSYSTT